jgi:ribosome biogenesis GTPase / thiamine phosphate phosphatase
MQLHELGWSPALAAQLQAICRDARNGDRGVLHPARVVREDREAYILHAATGPRLARVTGRLRHQAASRVEFPAVGDWVAAELPPGDGTAAIHAVLPRRSQFARQAAGTAGGAQIVAANVDLVLLVSGLDADFNPRRIERYLALAWESGASPVIVLNKVDMCPAPAERCTVVEGVAPGVPVYCVSARDGQGLAELRACLQPGTTAALLGSSGVGKSSLINAWLGTDRLRTSPVRADDSHGRHTTTHRELLLLPGGGVIIDTPGMRELQLLATDEALAATFSDVADLAAQCRFNDCRHEREPGCAIRAALACGDLDAARWASYCKLQRELAYAARREDVGARLAEKQRWKKIHIQAQKHMKEKRRM